MYYKTRGMMTGNRTAGSVASAALLLTLCSPALSLTDGGGRGPRGGTGTPPLPPRMLLVFAGPQGACCADDGTCAVTTSVTCGADNGAYLGDGTICSGDLDGDGRDNACPCSVSQDCDDGRICTDDACETDVCVHTNNTVSCNDGNACTTDDRCAGGTCVGGDPPNCSDGNICTNDSCDPGLGCQHADNTAPCTDGDACTTNDRCAGGSCVGGPPPNCSDGNTCTNDSCDSGLGCRHVDNTVGCNDGQFCTVNDACSGGTCVSGPPRNCSDGIACTNDLCNESINQCVNPPIEGCGDCNGNGIPDENDLQNCPGTPDCDDCNANLLPDECDIAGNPLLDLDGDGVLDACISPVVPPGTFLWTDDIWGLPGPVFHYPDNASGVAGLFVTLPDGFTIKLDANVEIEGLRVQVGAVLDVADELLSGNLTIRSGSLSGFNADGEIRVSTDRVIDVQGGFVTIAGAGKVIGVPVSMSPVSVVLEARGINLRETPCGATDQLTLIDNTSVVTKEDFVMDGRDAISCPLPSGRGATAASSALGGKTSPILRLRTTTAAAGMERASSTGVEQRTLLTIEGSFRMLRMAEPCIGCDTSPAAPVPNVVLHGDFDNQSEFPSLFDWSGGKLTLPVRVGAHVFEVAGLDIGVTPEGFDTDRDTLSDDERHSNFSINMIEIGDDGAGTAEVEFVNAVANTAGTGDEIEALYVRLLVLHANAKVVLNDSNIYYVDLIDQGATVQRNGPGRLISIGVSPKPDVPAVTPWGLAAMTVLVAIAAACVLSKRQQRSA